MRKEVAMANGDIETYHENGVWKNRPEGGHKASNTAETKAEAQSAGRQMQSTAASSTSSKPRRQDQRAKHLSTQPRLEPAERLTRSCAAFCHVLAWIPPD